MSNIDKVTKMAGRQYGNVSNGMILEETFTLGKLLSECGSNVQMILDIIQQAVSVQPMTEFKYKYDDNQVKNSVHIELCGRLTRRLVELENGFNDINERIFCLISIKRILKEVIDSYSQEDDSDAKYNMRACVILYEIIHKTKAENIEITQLPIIKEIVQNISTRNITKDDFVRYDEILCDAGLDWVFGGS